MEDISLDSHFSCEATASSFAGFALKNQFILLLFGSSFFLWELFRPGYGNLYISVYICMYFYLCMHVYVYALEPFK